MGVLDLPDSESRNMTHSPSSSSTPPPPVPSAAGPVLPESTTALPTGPVWGAESDLWTGRPHWKHYAGRIALWGVGNLGLAVLAGWLSMRVEWMTFWRTAALVAGLLVVSAVVMLGKMVLTILGTRYRLTSQRLFVERGILSQTVDQLELIRVDDVRLHKTLVDRFFGLGTILLVSTDATDRQVEIVGVADATSVAEAARSHMKSQRARTLHVESL